MLVHRPQNKGNVPEKIFSGNLLSFHLLLKKKVKKGMGGTN